MSKIPSVKEQFLALLDTAEEVTEKSSASEKNGSEDDQNLNPRIVEKGLDLLFPFIEDDPLYVSVDDGVCFVYRKGKLYQLDTKNRELHEDLRLEVYEGTGQPASRETVATGIELLSARARRDGEKIQLFNRIGKKNGKIYYYMGANNKAIEVSSGKWELVECPVMFRTFNHHQAQVKPDRRNADPWLLFEYIFLKEEQRLLFIVTLITCFIPQIAHPALHISGSQGGGKSFCTRLLKKIIDPSSVELSMMPRKPEDLDLLFFRHKALVLDNISTLSLDTCDRLCSIISGGVIEKRTLHTDLETTILRSEPVILYSSIGTLHSRPDLTERTIVFELQRIPDDKRLEEVELLRNFNLTLPAILGGIFEVLAEAVRIHPGYTLASVPRMADFAKWGCVIAEILGSKKGQFLTDYAANSSVQTDGMIELDTFFAAIVEAMNQPERVMLAGSFSEVLNELMEVAAPGEAKNGYTILQKDKTFPSARGFRKHLERIRIPLENLDISFTIDNQRTSKAKAFVTFKKIAPRVPGKPEEEEQEPLF